MASHFLIDPARCLMEQPRGTLPSHDVFKSYANYRRIGDKPPFVISFVQFKEKYSADALQRFVGRLEDNKTIVRCYFVFCDDDAVRGYMVFNRRKTFYAYLMSFRYCTFGVHSLNCDDESSLKRWTDELSGAVAGPFRFARTPLLKATTMDLTEWSYQRSWQLDSYERSVK